jgi:asparagine synthase (glutamine-hydrolysing)
MDRRLVEFCLALPPEQKFQQGWPRWILRNAMKGLLPDKICWRVGKSDLSYNFNRSMMVLEHEKISKLVLSESRIIERFVNMTLFDDVLRKGIANYVWPPVNLALWLQNLQHPIV